MRPARVALWVPSYPDGSSTYAGAFFATRAERYQGLGTQTLVLVPGEPREYVYHGVPVVQAGPEELAERARRFGAEALAVHAPRWRWRRALAGLGLPAVYWVHGAEALWTPSIPRPPGWVALQERRLRVVFRIARQQLFIRGLLRRSRNPVVTVSRWMAERLRSGLRLADLDVRVLPNPIDVERFAMSDPVDARPGSVVMLRSLSNRIYGFADAIRAFDGRRERPAGELTIIGEGSERARYQRLAERLRAPVAFIPSTVPHDQLPAVLSRYALLLNPTARDTQGVTMCEAMALGRPVVAYRVAAIPEYVRDGVDGILVSRGDVAGLRAAVEQLAGDRGFYQAASAAAAAHVREVCDPDRIAADELQLLSDAARRG